MSSFGIAPATVLHRRPLNSSEFIPPPCFSLKSRNTPTFKVSCYKSCFEDIGFLEFDITATNSIPFNFWYFVTDRILDEVTFGWPRQKGGLQMTEFLASRLVGLTGIPLDKDPQSLSGGFKRRLALAIQLVQTSDLLVLDEPLAGLDWKVRADAVKLLKNLKKELTILVVSHDLKELATLIDRSWRMDMGRILKEEPLPV